LRQMLCCVGLDYLRTEIFEEWSRYAGEEVEVRRAVEAAREVGGNGLEVLRGWLDEVYDRNLCILSIPQLSRGGARTSGIMWRVVPMFRCIVT
jgi:hypothetical protein